LDETIILFLKYRCKIKFWFIKKIFFIRKYGFRNEFGFI